MIIWGTGGQSVDLGKVEDRQCQTCGAVRPFKLFLQYRYFHLYYVFKAVTKKEYMMVCEVCRRGWQLEKAKIAQALGKEPIPFMTKYGLAVLGGIIVLVVVLVNVMPK